MPTTESLNIDEIIAYNIEAKKEHEKNHEIELERSYRMYSPYDSSCSRF